MNITLTAEQTQLIQTKLQSGKYATAIDLIDEALQLLQQRDDHYAQWLEETRAKVQIGLDQLDRGEGIEGELVVNQFKQTIQQMREAKE